MHTWGIVSGKEPQSAKLRLSNLQGAARDADGVADQRHPSGLCPPLGHAVAPNTQPFENYESDRPCLGALSFFEAS